MCSYTYTDRHMQTSTDIIEMSAKCVFRKKKKLQRLYEKKHHGKKVAGFDEKLESAIPRQLVYANRHYCRHHRRAVLNVQRYVEIYTRIQ